MAELTQDQIITKINDIDTAIATVISELATSGAGNVANLSYTIGSKTVDGTGRLKQLIEMREMYQKLLNKIPSITIRDHGYSVKDGTGFNETELIGDQ